MSELSLLLWLSELGQKRLQGHPIGFQTCSFTSSDLDALTPMYYGSPFTASVVASFRDKVDQ
eukprot:12893532-Prorocentrum_lima.AAC.1